MPSVPTNFVPSVGQTSPETVPLASPGVAPMQNAAPEQMQRTGATVTAAGDAADNIGLRIQMQMNDAQTKSAETQALKGALTVLHDPNTGYLNTRGLAAVNGYDDATKALQKAFADAQSTLTNPLQKRMFAQVANSHLMTFGTQMADHQFQQRTEYAGQAASDRADMLGNQQISAWADYGKTNPDGTAAGDYSKFQQAGHAEILAAVKQLHGAPEGSDIANKALLDYDSKASQGALLQMMDHRAGWQQVQSAYDTMKARGEMDARTIDTMGKMVQSYAKSEQVKGVGSLLADAQRNADGKGGIETTFPVQGATFATSPFDKEAGGVNITVPANSAVLADADGKVTKLEPNEDGDQYTMEITHKDGSMSTLQGLSAASVKVGDVVQRGDTIASSGDSGMQKNPSVFYSMKDANGAVVDPTKAGAAPVNIDTITDEGVLEKTLQSIRQDVKDPELQQMMVSQAEGIVRRNQQAQNQAKAQNYLQATNAFYAAAEQHGITPTTWHAIPQAIWNQLPKEQQYEFMSAWRHQPEGKDNTDKVAEFILDTDNRTPDWVQANRKYFTPSTYTRLLNDAVNFQNKPDKVIAANLDNQQLDTTLINNGMQGLATPKSNTEEWTQKNALVTNVRDQIDVEQQRLGRELSRDEKQTIMNNTIMNQVKVPGFFSDKTVPVFELTPDQQKTAYVRVGNEKITLSSIPAEERQQISRALQSRGKPVTEQSIATLWVQAGKPGQ